MNDKAENSAEIKVFDREQKSFFIEKILGDKFLRLAYLSPLRGILTPFLFKISLFSKLLGAYSDSKLSRGKIKNTIKELDIKEADFLEPVNNFRTFNEFFYRKLKPESRPYDKAPTTLVAPADARYTIIPKLAKETIFPIKGVSFTTSELLRTPQGITAPDFSNGSLFVARLCPIDYHRYHFPAQGKVVASWTIDGSYHSVNPIALGLGLRVFQENYRQVTILDFAEFGKAAFIEVGAFGVAGIEQTHNEEEFNKMDEKGYFKFGGSTVVMIFQDEKVKFSDDIVQQTKDGFECLIKVGETIGKAI